jgi:CRP-like cAMP-binding protein
VFGIKQRIYAEGEEGSAFYMILSGRVGLYINANKDGKIRLNNIAELKEGDSIGESALLYGAKHTSSAITTTNVELMVLTKDDYDSEFKGDELLVKTKITKFYKQQPMFQGLSDEKLEFVVNKTKRPVEFKTNDVIVKQGQVAETFYFLAKGRAKVLKRLDFKKAKQALVAPTARDYEYKQFDSKLIEIEEVGKGAVIGAYEAVRSEAYFATVVCAMPCLLYKVSLQDLRLLDYYENQSLVRSTAAPPSDADIRQRYLTDTLWDAYRTNYVAGIRREKRFKERFNFRMPAVSCYKPRSITPENMFGMPKTHLRLAPIDKLLPLTRTDLS